MRRRRDGRIGRRYGGWRPRIRGISNLWKRIGDKRGRQREKVDDMVENI